MQFKPAGWPAGALAWRTKSPPKVEELKKSDSAPVLPLRDIVVFPHMIVPLFVGREKSVRALEEVMNEDKQILLLTQKIAAEDDPTSDGLHTIGTMATVLQLLKLPDQTVRVLVEGKGRARVTGFTDRTDFFQANIEKIAEDAPPARETEALLRTVKTNFEQYIKLNKKIPSETLAAVAQIEEPARLADTVAAHLSVKISDRQALLETLSTTERLEKVLQLIEAEIGVLQVERKIRSRVKRQMEKTQREYYLNEQLKAIQKELGEGEEGRDEMVELEDRIRKTKLSKEAREKAAAEVKKLRSMSPMSAEATVVRNYLDWLLSLPWGKKSKVKKDIDAAEAVLHDDHYGLEKVKERILEYLAVQSRVGKIKGPILCLVGPPGVGKTSLGKSIAKATGREFVRMSLGGMRDEAEIRGHRQDLYRFHAGQDHPVDEEGEDLQSALPAGRDRQAGRRLPRRSVVGVAGSAGPRAEQHLQRPLSGSGFRPVRRDVRHHRQQPAHAAAADGPDGDHPHPRLHRR